MLSLPHIRARVDACNEQLRRIGWAELPLEPLKGFLTAFDRASFIAACEPFTETPDRRALREQVSAALSALGDAITKAILVPFTPEEDVRSGGTITTTSTPGTHVIVSAEEIAAIRALIAEFKEAVTAARVVDRALGTPDCEDPQKAKLEDRVAALEKKLAAMAGAAGA